MIRGSFFGLPFCFARFAGVVENDREVAREVDRRDDIVRGALEVRERDRKDWRSGVRSRDIGVCEGAIALAVVGEGLGENVVDGWSLKPWSKFLEAHRDHVLSTERC